MDYLTRFRKRNIVEALLMFFMLPLLFMGINVYVLALIFGLMVFVFDTLIFKDQICIKDFYIGISISTFFLLNSFLIATFYEISILSIFESKNKEFFFITNFISLGFLGMALSELILFKFINLTSSVSNDP